MNKTIFLSTMCIFAMLLTACSTNSGADTSSAVESAPDVQEEISSSSVPAEQDTAVSVDDILAAIQAAYGDAYPPDGEIPEEILQSEFGLSPEMVEEAKGVMAMVSVNNDRVVVVKAKPGQADAVEQALLDARQVKIDDTMQYPMNIAKTNAAQVVRNGDFVAFLLVGVNKEFADPEGAEAQQYAEEQVQLAVDAFNGVFQ